MRANEAFHAQKAGKSAKLAEIAALTRKLVEDYYASQRFKGLRPNSQANYRYNLDLALSVAGEDGPTLADMPVETVTADFCDRFADLVNDQHSYRRAFEVVTRLTTVWHLHLRRGRVPVNPWAKMGLRAPADRTTVWTRDQLDRFISQADAMDLWEVGTLALLCYDLCQRPCDMRALRWTDLQDGAFSFRQIKTGIEVICPPSPRLLSRLEGHRHNHPTILVQPDGSPYTRRINALAKHVRDTAGLPSDLWISDLRRTGATEMGAAGATEDEVRAITGHVSRAKLNVYVRPTLRTAYNGAVKRFAG